MQNPQSPQDDLFLCLLLRSEKKILDRKKESRKISDRKNRSENLLLVKLVPFYILLGIHLRK